MKKLLVLTLCLGLGAGVAYANFCAKDIVPAATLLVPFAVVDADPATGNPDPAGYTTLLTVTNASSARQIIHVTVWNMFSDTVVDFSEILSGYDVWTINFRDLINADFNLFDTYTQKSATYPQGYLTADGFFDPAATGPNVAPWGPTVNRTSSGDTAGDWPDLPGSQDIGPGEFTTLVSNPTGSCPPHNPKLTGGLKEYYRDTVIRETLTNIDVYPQAADDAYDCRTDLAISTLGSWLATFSPYPYRFYVTVDAVAACTQYFPDQRDYWTTALDLNNDQTPDQTGFSTANNVLLGWVYYVNFAANFSEALPAVHLERDADWATDTRWGFYDRYATKYGQQDGTEPLGDAYAVPYYTTGGLTSELIVWKDAPEWDQANGVFDACRRYTLYAWDEDEQFRSQTQQGGISPAPTAPGQINALPFETQKVPVNVANFPAIPGAVNGWLMLIFDSANEVDPDQVPADSQAYVALKVNYGTYSMAIEAALMANTNCFATTRVNGYPENNLQTYKGVANDTYLGFPAAIKP